MIALNAAANPDTHSRSMMAGAKGATRGRRRSKGTIAGFAFGKTGDTHSAPQAAPEANGETTGPSEHGGSAGSGTGSGQGNQPQHSSESNQSPGKPCHSARLALLCSQNAIRMGARTQLGLCPPGRSRRGLQAAMRQRTRTNRATSRRSAGQVGIDTGGYFGLEKMVGVKSLDDYVSQEEDYLLSTNTFDVESDEEASSGDEDDMTNIDDLLKEDAPSLDDEKKYIGLREPLFTPIGAESSMSAQGGSMVAVGGGTGKLPFNRRKIRFFDSMTAADRMAARSYLQQETRRSKQRESLLLSRHLRRLQRQERRRIKQERGEVVDAADVSDQENEDPAEAALLAGGVSQFDQPMTPAVAAALLIESLSLNPVESLEGMGKCYEGIVAAGVALLDSNVNDLTSPTNSDKKAIRSRSQIMAALTPLLITSLEQPSGEVILGLAKLRRMCGTPRYQRRFVQRVAPSLIRPPRGAMWCLRHQNDMEPILAAAELIFDSASDLFAKGWYERGQLLLADSKRAETLNTAAMQLRNLSTGPNESLTLGFGHHGHGMWRGNKFKAGAAAKDSATSANEHLAEWEVIAVDRQIRISISNVISMDWSKVVVHHSRDSDRSHRLSRSASKRPTVLPQSSSGDLSPKSIVSSPLSPGRSTNAKMPVSPPPDAAENSFPASFSAAMESLAAGEHGGNPAGATSTVSKATPLSPPVPNRSGIEEIESKLPSDQVVGPPNSFTPPRSPKSPKREITVEASASLQSITPMSVSPLSPRRSKASPGTSIIAKESISSQSFGGPLSPSSVGTGSASDAVPFRPVSSASSVMSVGSSIVSGGTQPAHYRMLTSTAAERKRTVAACRALRAQITRFEDAFIQLHGRPPKGAAERAPLATTYAQYREWKRAIRADAACRIQALFRGARTRWMLLRSNNPRISRVVTKRAGRFRFSDHGERMHPAGQDNVLKQLSIPAEIGEPGLERNSKLDSVSGSIVPVAGSKPFNDVNPNMFASQGHSGGQPPAPQWANQIVRRRPGGGGAAHDGFAGSSVGKPFPSPSGSTSSVASSEDVMVLSLPELQARKRDLKQQLKQYDMDFARKHGRMPVKAEKEPIRHLYENYNALKSQISLMEQEGRHLPSPVGQQSSPVLSQRTISPTAGIDSGSDDNSPNPATAMRGKRKPLKSPPFEGSPGGTVTPAGSPSQDLSALKAEKGKLHQMLRSYEKDFFKEHKRQVSSFADIKPVASQYRRYKEIKKQIAALQQSGER